MKRFECFQPFDLYGNPNIVESADGEYILYSDFVKALAMIYNGTHHLPNPLVAHVAVANVIDDHLDKSGALIGEVRDAAEQIIVKARRECGLEKE